jgi:septal ring factor EnvC (AmiA/AmiB activator)
VAGELYGEPSGDFVARRNAAASGAGKGLAKEIKALRKPSAAAAAINALVRERAELVDDILAVGDRMRDAFADRDRAAIRELTQERQRLLHRATNGLELSASVLREVEETLQAAVIDAAAAAAVRSGMLVRALESTGVDQVDVSDAVALPVEVQERAPAPRERPSTGASGDAAKGASKGTAKGTANGDAAGASASAPARGSEPEPAPEPRESASERRERQRRLRAAEKAVERARADADELDDDLDEEVERRSDLEAERDSLERRLQRVTAELADSKAAERALRKRISEAQRALRDAERSLRSLRDDD